MMRSIAKQYREEEQRLYSFLLLRWSKDDEERWKQEIFLKRKAHKWSYLLTNLDSVVTAMQSGLWL